MKIALVVTEASAKEADLFKHLFQDGIMEQTTADPGVLIGNINLNLQDGKQVPPKLMLEALSGVTFGCVRMYDEAINDPLYKSLDTLGLSAEDHDELCLKTEFQLIGELIESTALDLGKMGLSEETVSRIADELKTQGFSLGTDLKNFPDPKILEILAW